MSGPEHPWPVACPRVARALVRLVVARFPLVTAAAAAACVALPPPSPASHSSCSSANTAARARTSCPRRTKRPVPARQLPHTARRAAASSTLFRLRGARRRDRAHGGHVFSWPEEHAAPQHNSPKRQGPAVCPSRSCSSADAPIAAKRCTVRRSAGRPEISAQRDRPQRLCVCGPARTHAPPPPPRIEHTEPAPAAASTRTDAPQKKLFWRCWGLNPGFLACLINSSVS